MTDDLSQIASLLGQMTIRCIAVRDVTACLLAAQAKMQGEPAVFFRLISDGLDQRLAATIPGDRQHLVPMTEQIRSEIDWMIEAAQRLLGQIPPMTSGGQIP